MSIEVTLYLSGTSATVLAVTEMMSGEEGQEELASLLDSSAWSST